MSGHPGNHLVEHFLELGWNAAAIARSEETLARVRERGALALAADAADDDSLTGALQRVRQELGSLDAIVNAVSAARPTGGPFGGGGTVRALRCPIQNWPMKPFGSLDGINPMGRLELKWP